MKAVLLQVEGNIQDDSVKARTETLFSRQTTCKKTVANHALLPEPGYKASNWLGSLVSISLLILIHVYGLSMATPLNSGILITCTLESPCTSLLYPNQEHIKHLIYVLLYTRK